MQRLFLRLKHCNGENENECKNFHDVAGWSRVLDPRPPGQKKRRCSGQKQRNHSAKKACHSGKLFFK